MKKEPIQRRPVVLLLAILLAPFLTSIPALSQPPTSTEPPPGSPRDAAGQPVLLPLAPPEDDEEAEDDAGDEEETDLPPLPEPLSEEERRDKRLQEWLSEVEPLILRNEREMFESLGTSYQKEAFIHGFWQARDPFPETARNELRDRWEERLATARTRFPSLQDDRARVYLVHGPPQQGFEVTCTLKFRPAEVWIYEASEHADFPFLLIFLNSRKTTLYRLWRPDQFGSDPLIDQARLCINGERLLQAVSVVRQQGSNYLLAMQAVIAKPKPRSEEWLATFRSFTTDLPEGAETFEASFDLEFPGRYQSRTVAQGLVQVPRDRVESGNLAGHQSYDFLLTGEVTSGNRLFESFRYKFGIPIEAATSETIPLAFQRLLRPGSYQLILKLEDLNGGRFFRQEQALEIPRVETVVADLKPQDSESARLFEEATAAIASGETSIRLIPPPLDLLTGFVRFDTLAVGDSIQKARFLLDGERVLTKNRPPFNVEIDLGPFPRLRELQVEALDAGGEVVAKDELLLNSGGNRFSIKLIEPRRGERYERSLLARAEVHFPDSRSLDRVEIYLDETLVATLYQAPFVQPIQLPTSGAISYVRAVAYLPDGNSTEDLVFINAPDYLEEIDVQLVELYTSVQDQAGRPVQNLTATDFRVIEDETPQRILRFDRVENLPIHVGVLLDNSGSMRGSLDHARHAALEFFKDVISPRDRAALITFNRIPTLAVKLTNDLRLLGGGLAGLVPEGETALYDSLMFSLYYFTGIKGQRALLLLSDGKDEASRFSFEETLEYARRAGVTLYTVGLDLGGGGARQHLELLADETGGRSFFIRRVEELPDIYELIQKDLRSQYLLAYQSTNTNGRPEFRRIELELSRPDLSAKTISGYYP